jgi:phosphoribosylamine--glycine ligase
MNILVLGSGGRENAFCWKLSKSKLINKIFAAPGNAGTGFYAENHNISVNDFEKIKALVLEKEIKMVLVGPEEPLVRGIHDYFLKDDSLREIHVIGPQKKGALLEGSKSFAKEFMARNKIPTAKYLKVNVDNIDDGELFLEELSPPYVLKADGLAAGKGVLILNNLNEAKTELTKMLLDQKFGKASRIVVIEEFLEGVELSCFVLTDGKNYISLPMAKDYKKIGEGDVGLNTGGMGAISPVPFVSKAFKYKIEEKIIKPTIKGLEKEEIPFRGFIFIGLIKVEDEPKVIEYNVRMGDPETEAVLPRIKNDFGDILKSLVNNKLKFVKMEFFNYSTATVVSVSKGYPGEYEKGKEIKGFENTKESVLFHCGTIKESQKVFTNGGRVLAVTSFGKNFKQALLKSYSSLNKIKYQGIYYRRDIGFDL